MKLEDKVTALIEELAEQRKLINKLKAELDYRSPYSREETDIMEKQIAAFREVIRGGTV